MTGLAAKIRVGAAAAVAAALIALVFLTVHPDRLTGWAGVVPLAAVLWAAFAAGVLLVRRIPVRWAAPVILLGAIGVQLAALSAPPQGSDDLYRYIWDGRVQAAGIDPYAYSPAAPQLAFLRDRFLWPHHVTAWCVSPGTQLYGSPHGLAVPGCTLINRPIVHTIYPPVAEAYFYLVHLVSPAGSGTTPVQVAAAICAVALTVLLLLGLGRLGLDRRLAVLWAWCPTVALEAGNNAHVDVLAAGLTAAALLVLAQRGRLRRSLAGGTLLALAIWTKVTPVLVVPAVARRRWYALISAGLFATVVVYLPHVLAVGSRVIGFVPGYLQQEGYNNGTRFLLLGTLVHGKPGLLAAFAVLAVTGLLVLLARRPGPAVARRDGDDRGRPGRHHAAVSLVHDAAGHAGRLRRPGRMAQLRDGQVFRGRRAAARGARADRGHRAGRLCGRARRRRGGERDPLAPGPQYGPASPGPAGPDPGLGHPAGARRRPAGARGPVAVHQAGPAHHPGR